MYMYPTRPPLDNKLFVINLGVIFTLSHSLSDHINESREPGLTLSYYLYPSVLFVLDPLQSLSYLIQSMAPPSGTVSIVSNDQTS